MTWPFRLDRLPSWLVPAFGVALLDVLVAIWPAPALPSVPFSRRMAWPAALRRTLRIVDLELKALDPDRIKALRSLGYIQ